MNKYSNYDKITCMSFLKRTIKILRSNINSSLDEISSRTFSGFEEVNIQGERDIHFFEEEFAQKTSSPMSETEKLEREYYGNFELPYGASFEEIKASYKKLLKKYHPDKFQTDETKRKIAEDVVSKLNSAYSYFEEKYKK